jgi:hypothetical protein
MIRKKKKVMIKEWKKKVKKKCKGLIWEVKRMWGRKMKNEVELKMKKMLMMEMKKLMR